MLTECGQLVGGQMGAVRRQVVEGEDAEVDGELPEGVDRDAQPGDHAHVQPRDEQEVDRVAVLRVVQRR